ncbi:phage scaffolding protein [Mammaliicoccus vitulinus]|uniref:phage scaffolding protein n=1 Tax=Mammaliicoccus vitulinus TaxID=71237 RepID=UPI00194DD799|nr:phage scaffolding protein [Mammaliicoccus vitulinus]MBM6628568.1 phage scaffolding protein [Mammaliicoccus vitulinus]
MNRESLKELGLSDEQIEKVMTDHGKAVGVYKSQLTEKDSEVQSLESEKETLSKQITTLEKKANDYNSLEEQNNKLQEEIKDYKIQVSSNELDKKILKEVSKDAYDADDVFHFINKDKFNRDEESGEITNFNEVIQELRESKGYLFNQSSNSSSANDNPGEEETTPGNPEYKSGGQQGNGKQEINYENKGKELASKLFPNQKEE